MRLLEGLRIVDLTTMISGPYCTLLLADNGAEVIKIESPDGGDITRSIQADDPRYHDRGISSYFLTVGRNKRSVVLDLRSEDGRAVLHDLARVSDVIVDNYRPGVLERLGADHATLKRINPRIIACSVTGYGLTGPGRDRAAYDACIQAYAGVMTITGDDGTDPMRAGLPYADLCGGMMAAIAILGAVRRRERTGEGAHIDISMLDTQLSMWTYMATMNWMSPGNPFPRLGNQHPSHVPYNGYRTGDGKYLFIAINPDAHWRQLVDAVASVALAGDAAEAAQRLRDERFARRKGRWAGRDEINALMSAVMAGRSRGDWLDALLTRGIPCAPVNGVQEAFDDPQARARDMLVEVPHPLGGTLFEPGNPIKVSDAGPDTFAPPPLLGQHTVEVLAGVLGYDGARIDALLQSKAARTATP
ncbi:MAG: CoA transferase [SAR202 cluster bacterium]|nr:CoA transferase [SAR202 cluster bacterium]